MGGEQKKAESHAKESSPAKPMTVDLSATDKTKLQIPSRPLTGIGSRSVRASSKSGRGHSLVCSTCNEISPREGFKFCSEEEEDFVCPQCRLRAMDPFSPLREGQRGLLKLSLVQPPLVQKNMFFEARFAFNRDFRKLKE